jgi:DNA-binding CsgD family transcriptional regulator
MSKAITTAEKKNKGGRPLIKLTNEQLEELKMIAPVCTLQEIADYFGFSIDTFQRLKSRDEEVLRIYKKAKIQAKAMVGGSLMKKALAGDTTAAIFYMKTQGGWSSKGSSEEKIKIPLGNRSALEISNNILIALEKGEISVFEAQQLTSLAITKINIESRTQVDKAVSKQMSIEETRAFVKELDETLQKLDLLEQHIKLDTKK